MASSTQFGALMAACRSDDVAAIVCLLDAAPALAMTADEHGRLALHHAALHGHKSVVRLLLQAAPAAVMASNETGRLPLHTASSCGHDAVVRLLLEAAPGAAMTGDEYGSLPLHYAARQGQEGVVRLLLQAAPAAARVKTLSGCTPLRLALVEQRIPTARLLLGVGSATAVLTALVNAGARSLPVFPHFLLAPGRLSLAVGDWALLPTPCPGLGAALPAALACSAGQAVQVVRRLEAAQRARLRAAALCLAHGRFGRHRGLPGDVAALVLAHVL